MVHTFNHDIDRIFFKVEVSNYKRKENQTNLPLSSMSRDEGVSSSCIRTPSYRNLGVNKMSAQQTFNLTIPIQEREKTLAYKP